MGFLECLTCFLLSFVVFNDASVVAALLFLMNFSVAVMDVVIEGLMVCQSRLDPDYGAEDLNTLGWTMVGFGGIIGSVVGGLINEHSSPRYCYLITAGLGFWTMLQASLMKK